MLVKKIKYTDYNGVEREEDFYFHLNKAELTKWLTTQGAYTIDAVLQKMIDTENVRDMVNEFEFLILESYGEKSLDGKTFIKNEEIKNRFKNSEAYANLFMELVGDAQKAAEFFNKIIPADLASEVSRIVNENPEGLPDAVKDYIPKQQAGVVNMPTNK